MYYLALLFPGLKGKRLLPLSRDQLMLLMAAINLLFLGFDIYLAHNLNGTIRPREWIPIIFGAAAGVLLLFAGLIALRWRRMAAVIATVVLSASIVVGLLGAYFHVVRAIRPNAPLGQIVTTELLVWAPPIVGPLIFSLVGVWGVSAAWAEDPPDSGRWRFWGQTRLRLPFSKTRAYLFMVSLGTLATLLSSVLDHGRAQFENPWLWPPIVVGVFATVVALGLGVIDRPNRGDVAIYLAAMLLLLLTGLVGFLLHIQFDLTTQNVIVPERFLRGAPFLAPMLFANMGLVGLISILSPIEADWQPAGAGEQARTPASSRGGLIESVRLCGLPEPSRSRTGEPACLPATGHARFSFLDARSRVKRPRIKGRAPPGVYRPSPDALSAATSYSA